MYIGLVYAVRSIHSSETPFVWQLIKFASLLFQILYVWIESFQLVFVQIYGFNLGENGLAYMGVSAVELCRICLSFAEDLLITSFSLVV